MGKQSASGPSRLRIAGICVIAALLLAGLVFTGLRIAARIPSGASPETADAVSPTIPPAETAQTAEAPAETPAAETPEDIEVSVFRDLLYDEPRGLLYDLYIPSDVRSDRLLLLLHGGGWYSGSKESMDGMARTYAREGFVAATMNYSLLSVTDPETTMDTILDEITACVSAVTEECAARSIPLSSLAIGGHSAGAHLSMLYAWSRTDTQPLPAAFVIDLAGPVNFHPESWVDRCMFSGTEASYSEMISHFLGRDLTIGELRDGTVDAQLDAMDPTRYLTEDSAPVLMVYGGRDTVISSDHRELLKQAAEQAGVPHIFYLFPNGDHGISSGSDPDLFADMYETSLQMLQQPTGQTLQTPSS